MSFNDENNVTNYYYSFNEKPMEIRKKCETNYYINNKNSSFNIGRPFDEGVYGSLAEVCKDNVCKYIVKAIPFKIEATYQSFLREALIAPLMAKHNIGPKIFDIFICLNTGYIIMEKWDGTIRNIHKYIKHNHIIEISDLIVKMHKLGVIHNDMHTANILYKVVNNKYIFSITDFGLSLYFENKNEIIPKKFLPNYKCPDIYFPAFDFFKLSNALEHRKDVIFITFFFNKGYISLLDYILVDKFWFRTTTRITSFYKYISKVKLNEKEINIKPYLTKLLSSIDSKNINSSLNYSIENYNRNTNFIKNLKSDKKSLKELLNGEKSNCLNIKEWSDIFYDAVFLRFVFLLIGNFLNI